MKFLIPLTLVAFALFCCGNAIVSAQNDERSNSDLELAQRLEVKRKVEADLAALRKAKQELQNKSNRKKKADQAEADGASNKMAGFDEKQIEAWAEKYAGEWESWAEKFEQKMEKWAEGQEQQWEKWADNYSEQWEGWAEKIESGEIQPEEIQKLLEKNLKMLSDMPLAEMIDGGLKEGLGELKNMPIESLGELHELVGGSLEQALGAMEKEIAAAAGSEIKKALGELETGELKKAIGMLQDSIQSQQRQIDDSAKEKIVRLKELLKNKDELSEQQLAEITSALEKEITNAITLSKKQEELSLKSALESVDRAAADQDAVRALHAKLRAEVMKQMQNGQQNVEAARKIAEAQKVEALAKQAQRMAEKAQAMAKMKEQLNQNAEAVEKTEVMNKADLAEALAKAKSKLDSQSKNKLEEYFTKLKAQQENLKEKESEIEAMRREIRELRKEVERMKQDKD